MSCRPTTNRVWTVLPVLDDRCRVWVRMGQSTKRHLRHGLGRRLLHVRRRTTLVVSLPVGLLLLEAELHALSAAREVAGRVHPGAVHEGGVIGCERRVGVVLFAKEKLVGWRRVCGTFVALGVRLVLFLCLCRCHGGLHDCGILRAVWYRADGMWRRGLHDGRRGDKID